MKNRLMVVCAVSTLALLGASCAHHRDVRPGAGGLNRVVTRAGDKEAAERDALRQAEHYCEQFQKYPAITEEKTSYQGSMDEETRKTLRNASKAASVLGSVHVGHQSEASRVLRGAGTTGSIMTGDDAYVTDVRFKCE